MKLFTAFFSFICLYSLNCSAAKAEAYSNRTAQHREIASQVCSKPCNLKLELGKWLSWPLIVSEEIHFNALEAKYSEPFKDFRAICTKDFYIRTGLSPPLLFV